MRRGSPLHVAFASAFARSLGRVPSAVGRRQRLHPGALAFVVGFPGLIGAAMVWAAFSRSGVNDGAFAPGVVLLTIAGVLLILGLLSVISVGRDDLTVRFFGLRATNVRFQDLTSATVTMTFPSISFAMALTDRSGRRAVVHANWWREEASIVLPVCRALVEFDVPMDRSIARVVSKLLKIHRPKARIIHHGLLNNDRTW
jgi:hypothetical protein